MKLLRKRSLVAKGLPLFIFLAIISYSLEMYWNGNLLLKGLILAIIWIGYIIAIRYAHLHYYDFYYRADTLILKNKLEERWIDFNRFLNIQSDGSEVQVMGRSEYGYVITFRNEKNDVESVSFRGSLFKSNLEDFLLFLQRERPDLGLHFDFDN